MNDSLLCKIYDGFAADSAADSFEQCRIGHINRTYFVYVSGEPKYVLQRINTAIFKDADALMENIVNVTDHIRRKVEAVGGDPAREVLTLVPAKCGGFIVRDDDDGCWRMYHFIRGARTYQLVDDPVLFYNSAVAFGHFQRQLADFPAEKLTETIPNFHNTVSRFADFRRALEADVCGRASSVKDEIEFVLSHESICSYITDKIADGTLPLRVTHNDTKLNNVMIDDETKRGICVIDLDTVMPGSVLYDFGDSIRFGASSAEEDERDLSRVFMRLDLFDEYTRGFLCGLDGSLTPDEIRALPMGAIVITFETGIRFLGDYLSGDTYFSTEREGQNLDRARTQFKLVADMENKLEEMRAAVEKYL